MESKLIPRFVVTVERSKMTTEFIALVIKDEADLKQQLAEHEAELRTAKYVGKAKRDDKGKLISHQLGKDWNIK